MSTEEQQEQERPKAEEEARKKEEQEYKPTQEQIDEFWGTETTRIKEGIVKETKGDILGAIDKDIHELTGVEKGSQATHKYLKSSFEGLKGKITELEGENKTLKEGGTPSDVLEAQIKTKDSLISELQGKLNDMATNNEKSQIRSGIVADVQDIPLSKSLMAEAHTRKLVETERERVISDMQNNSEIVDGKTLYKKADGKPWLDGKGGYETAGEVFRQQMKPYIETSVPPSGAGTGKDKAPTGRSISDDAPTTSIEEAMKFLNDNASKYGLAKHSKEYLVELEKINKKLGLT